MMKQRIFFIFCCIILLGGSGCQSWMPWKRPIESMSGRAPERLERVRQSAEAALSAGREEEALYYFSVLYQSFNQKDEKTTLIYARLLRHQGQAQKSLEILRPFIRNKSDHAEIKIEYAASLVEETEFKEAESILNGFLEDEKMVSFHARAQNVLGVALDSQGQHQEAEQLFRLAIENWQGNPASVFNNLGLCLAHAGKFEEATNALRQASILAPEQKRIAENLDFIERLKKISKVKN